MASKGKTHIVHPEPGITPSYFCGVKYSLSRPHVQVHQMVYKIPGDLCDRCWDSFQGSLDLPHADNIYRDRMIEASRHLFQNMEVLRRFYGHSSECLCWKCLGDDSPECEILIERLAEYFSRQCECSGAVTGEPCWECREKAERLFRDPKIGLQPIVKKAYYGQGWTGFKR